MQFAVALIEYLISGVVASAWLTVILDNHYPIPFHKINEYKEVFIVVYLPIAYILGIYVDTTSSYLIRRTGEIFRLFGKRLNVLKDLRQGLSSIYRAIAGTPKEDSYERSAAILARSVPDAVRTMEAYVSRDRIARGAALNAFAGSVTAFFYAPPEYQTVVTVICSVACVYSIIMHKRLRRLSSRFKEVALSNLKKIKSTEPDEIES
ncbi:hypothetical protein J1G34_18625 [Pseudomonas sp. Wu6]|jgi:hypothetical protein|uniref:Uncharacterized protein n=1 Tax=Pseudomonas orientalis TaxID=76758 RepID=A0A4Q7D2D9_9PSED|nr:MULTISPECIES: hypothetical protein [Pseudomonas]MBY8931056.1 hypothetical protein [Pseudomonas sp. Wu6]RZI33064.1 hypothetical protein EUX57_03440 [Pseudomonas orientalis]CRM41564.1 hypothetical protein [Pseudomonas sp. 44 R 15]